MRWAPAWALAAAAAAVAAEEDGAPDEWAPPLATPAPTRGLDECAAAAVMAVCAARGQLCEDVDDAASSWECVCVGNATQRARARPVSECGYETITAATPTPASPPEGGRVDVAPGTNTSAPPPVIPPDEERRRTLTFATGTAGVIAMITLNPALAVHAGRLALVDTLHCRERVSPLQWHAAPTAVRYPWMYSPVGVGIGSDPLRWELGAVVVNVAVLALLCAVAALLARWFRVHRAAGSLAVAVVYVLPGCVFAGVRLVTASDEGHAGAAPMLAGAAAVAVVLTIPCVVLKTVLAGLARRGAVVRCVDQHGREAGFGLSSVPAGNGFTASPPSPGAPAGFCGRVVAQLQCFALGKSCWVAQSTRDPFVTTHYGWFAQHRFAARGWLLADCALAAVVAAAMAATAGGSAAACEARNMVVSCALAVYLFAVVAGRPYLALYETVAAFAMGGICVAAAVKIVVAGPDGAPTGSDGVIDFGCVALVIKAIADLLVFLAWGRARRVRAEASGAEEMSRQIACIEGDDDDEEGGGGGDGDSALHDAGPAQPPPAVAAGEHHYHHRNARGISGNHHHHTHNERPRSAHRSVSLLDPADVSGDGDGDGDGDDAVLTNMAVVPHNNGGAARSMRHAGGKRAGEHGGGGQVPRGASPSVASSTHHSSTRQLACAAESVGSYCDPLDETTASYSQLADAGGDTRDGVDAHHATPAPVPALSWKVPSASAAAASEISTGAPTEAQGTAGGPHLNHSGGHNTGGPQTIRHKSIVCSLGANGSGAPPTTARVDGPSGDDSGAGGGSGGGGKSKLSAASLFRRLQSSVLTSPASTPSQRSKGSSSSRTMSNASTAVQDVARAVSQITAGFRWPGGGHNNNNNNNNNGKGTTTSFKAAAKPPLAASHPVSCFGRQGARQASPGGSCETPSTDCGSPDAGARRGAPGQSASTPRLAAWMPPRTGGAAATPVYPTVAGSAFPAAGSSRSDRTAAARGREVASVRVVGDVDLVHAEDSPLPYRAVASFSGATALSDSRGTGAAGVHTNPSITTATSATSLPPNPSLSIHTVPLTPQLLQLDGVDGSTGSGLPPLRTLSGGGLAAHAAQPQAGYKVGAACATSSSGTLQNLLFPSTHSERLALSSAAASRNGSSGPNGRAGFVATPITARPPSVPTALLTPGGSVRSAVANTSPGLLPASTLSINVNAPGSAQETSSVVEEDGVAGGILTPRPHLPPRARQSNSVVLRGVVGSGNAETAPTTSTTANAMASLTTVRSPSWPTAAAPGTPGASTTPTGRRKPQLPGLLPRGGGFRNTADGTGFASIRTATAPEAVGAGSPSNRWLHVDDKGSPLHRKRATTGGHAGPSAFASPPHNPNVNPLVVDASTPPPASPQVGAGGGSLQGTPISLVPGVNTAALTASPPLSGASNTNSLAPCTPPVVMSPLLVNGGGGAAGTGAGSPTPFLPQGAASAARAGAASPMRLAEGVTRPRPRSLAQTTAAKGQAEAHRL